ncbi:ABC-F family ATP-binding cassette domain-containing protein, partial [bacterium]|nr:ABC-F family ATP-binding cassette domain-containing protein [bacterium]
EEKERIGLIGPNGAGKTTLLKILAGLETPDTGDVVTQRGLKTAYLAQTPLFKDNATVLDTVLEGTPAHAEDWERHNSALALISKLDLPAEALISKLSGGLKKKTALARELAKEPDLLFLDEPTNHLDIETILGLEEFLQTVGCATLTITHDRLFLEKISNRLLELDRRNENGLLSVNGTYSDYLEIKEELMSAQEKREESLKNTLRRETEWLRQGAKARSTKQKARIERAGDLKEAVEAISARNVVKKVKIDFENSTLPKVLLKAGKISKSHDGKKLFENFDLLVSPGTRLGILGKNGAGKSSLIRVLLKQEEPDKGTVFHADQLKVAYFEQNRDMLDPTLTLAKTFTADGDYVTYRGNKIHIKGYLEKFLFDATQMNMAVGKLSGGEQSRILIAKLMLQPANVLVLDEPTNDLDIATLNILQDCLTEFEGAVILVTHDRYFFDAVVNKVAAFMPRQTKLEFFADLSQWEDAYRSMEPETEVEKEIPAVPKITETTKKKKLSYKDQREFDGMEKKIGTLEETLQQLEEDCGKTSVASNPKRLQEITTQMATLKNEIDQLYKRWAELEAQIS